MSATKSVNIDANMVQALGSINKNYEAIVGVVATLMGISAMEAKAQADLAALFTKIEHMSDAEYKQFMEDHPEDKQYNFTNALYHLDQGGDTSKYSTQYSADQQMYNSANNTIGGFISQVNQITSQNTQAEGTTTGIGSSIANFENGVSRLLTY